MPAARARRARAAARAGRAAGPTTLVVASLAQLAQLAQLGTTAGAQVAGPRAAPLERTVASSRVLTYTLRARLPAGLSRDAAFAAGPGKLLLVGGLAGAGRVPVATASLLDVATGSDVVVGQLRSPVVGAARASLGRLQLLIGGSSAAPGGSGAALSPVLSVGISNGPARWHDATVGSLPVARAGAGGAVLQGRAVVAGGETPGRSGAPATPQASVLATSDGRRFTTIGQLAQPVSDAAVVAFDGALFVIGGAVVEGGVTVPVATVQELRPGQREASVVARLPEAVSGAAAWVASGTLYVAGGDGGSSSAGTGTLTSGSIWAYDVPAELFVLTGNLAPVSHAAVVVEGRDAYVVGGEYDGAPVGEVQEVVPAPGAAGGR